MRRMLDLYVDCEPARRVGETLDGLLNIIPIVGGTVEGDIQGTVLSGGSDWNYTLRDDIASVCAKYMFQAEDGTYIGIENSGMIVPEVNGPETQTDNEPVIITRTRFWADIHSPYAYLNHGVYVGSLEVKNGVVHVTIYDVNSKGNALEQ